MCVGQFEPGRVQGRGAMRLNRSGESNPPTRYQLERRLETSGHTSWKESRWLSSGASHFAHRP